MSNRTATPAPPTTSSPPRPPMRSGFGPFGGGMPVEKPMSFWPSVRRLMKRLSPERLRLITVIALGVTSVALMVIGPKILGRATDLIFSGAIGKHLPAGLTTDQVVAAARASGNANLADLLARMHVVPGQGIDFHALGGVLVLALGLYVASALFSWMQGYLLNDVVQRTVFLLRADVEDKLGRLPLQFFDNQPRGELLSRVTNDIDNVSVSLQQTISQLLSGLLTVVGVVVMMFVVSPLLALIALVTIPLSVVITTQVAKRSQKLFAAQWAHTGALNGHIEEAFTGHELVKVFGRRREVEEVFRARNEGR